MLKWNFFKRRPSDLQQLSQTIKEANGYRSICAAWRDINIQAADGSGLFDIYPLSNDLRDRYAIDFDDKSITDAIIGSLLELQRMKGEAKKS